MLKVFLSFLNLIVGVDCILKLIVILILERLLFIIIGFRSFCKNVIGNENVNIIEEWCCVFIIDLG